MTDPQLIAYIQSSRQAGFADDRIWQALMRAGWNQTAVQEAFGEIDTSYPNRAVTEAAPRDAQPVQDMTGAASEEVAPSTAMAIPVEREDLAASPLPTEAANTETRNGMPKETVEDQVVATAPPVYEPARHALFWPVWGKRAVLVVVVALGIAAGFFAARAFGIPEPVRALLGDIRNIIPYLASPSSPLPTATETSSPSSTAQPAPTPALDTQTEDFAIPAAGLERFLSDESFSQYIASAAVNTQGTFGGSFFAAAAATDRAITAAPGTSALAEGSSAQRVSQTNIQVRNVDEPDIVKTDGKRIYYARNADPYGYPLPIFQRMEESVENSMAPSEPAPEGIAVPPSYIRQAPPQNDNTLIINAFPPEAMAQLSMIDKTGALLLKDTVLVMLPSAQPYYGFGYDESGQTARPAIRGYDIADPTRPKILWTMELKERTSLVEARLTDGKLYAILQTGVSYDTPCPLTPVILKGVPYSIPCTEIWHPIGKIAADATYALLVINPADGIVERKTAVTAPSYATTFMMSRDSLYMAYPLEPDFIRLVWRFFAEDGRDFIPAEALERLRKLADYDLSRVAKMAELAVILEQAFDSLGEGRDENLVRQNELANRSRTFFAKHARSLAKTALIKFDAKTLGIAASGEIPGTLLNQWALDEHKGFLRAASTIDPRMLWWGFGFPIGGIGARSDIQSVNDVYVLDGKLAIIGSVKDLGLDERIFGVRFMEDRGYVVTFRQIDPFYVLDLSIPASPALKGELKIPGFSSYLHPMGERLVLGVGQEGSQAKVALFDVSDPAQPKEASKYLINEYWTGVSETHHAFLLDEKHEVFFLPGAQGGYIFSYADKQLKMIAAVAGVKAERAVYLDDYLYIVAKEKIVVYDETSWQKVREFGLSDAGGDAERDARRVGDLRQVQLALELYFDASASYPPVSAYDELGKFLAPGYLSALPQDPKSGGVYMYRALGAENTACAAAPCTQYILSAKLEDTGTSWLASDRDDAPVGLSCADPIYCVGA